MEGADFRFVMAEVFGVELETSALSDVDGSELLGVEEEPGFACAFRASGALAFPFATLGLALGALALPLARDDDFGVSETSFDRMLEKDIGSDFLAGTILGCSAGSWLL